MGNENFRKKTGFLFSAEDEEEKLLNKIYWKIIFFDLKSLNLYFEK